MRRWIASLLIISMIFSTNSMQVFAEEVNVGNIIESTMESIVEEGDAESESLETMTDDIIEEELEEDEIEETMMEYEEEPEEDETEESIFEYEEELEEIIGTSSEIFEMIDEVEEDETEESMMEYEEEPEEDEIEDTMMEYEEELEGIISTLSEVFEMTGEVEGLEEKDVSTSSEIEDEEEISTASEIEPEDEEDKIIYDEATLSEAIFLEATISEAFLKATLSELMIASESDIILYEEPVLLGHPSKYDSRDIVDANGFSIVPPIRNRNVGDLYFSYRNKWIFPAVALAEISARKQGLPGADCDLSEAVFGYYAFNMKKFWEDHEGDPNYIDLPCYQGKDYQVLDGGRPPYDNGNTALALMQAATTRIGFVEEVAGETDYTKAVLDKFYSHNIDGKYAFKSNKYEIKNYYSLRTSHPEFREMAKSMIEKNGAIGFSHNYNSAYHVDSSGTYYCMTKGSLEADNANFVCVVGWDDTIPKEKFYSDADYASSTYKADENGAWLVRDCEGTSAHKDGYYWISYKDLTIRECYSIEVEEANQYKYNYHYDSSGYDFKATKESKVANVYKIDGRENQLLESVSFGTSDKNTEFYIQVYTSDTAEPESGIKRIAGTGQKVNFGEAGYYTVKLSEPISLKKGAYFSIVIINLGRKTIIVDKTDIPSWFEVYNETSPGQSFVYDGSVWKDYYDINVANIRINGLTNYYPFDFVDWNLMGHGGSSYTTYVTTGSKISLSTPSEWGYDFLGWYKEKECITKWDFSNDIVNDNVELFAKWEWIPGHHFITFKDGQTAGITITGDMEIQKFNTSTVTLNKNNFTCDTKVFDCWKDQYGATYSDEQIVTFSGVPFDMILEAQWRDPIVSFVWKGHSADLVAAQSIPIGLTVSPPTVPEFDGYDFIGWYKEEECTNRWIMTAGEGGWWTVPEVVTKDITLYGYYKLHGYRIVYSEDSKGSYFSSFTTETYTMVDTTIRIADYMYSLDRYMYFWYWKDDNGYIYEPGDEIEAPVPPKDLFLYAEKWGVPKPPIYKVTFDLNGYAPLGSVRPIKVPGDHKISYPTIPEVSGYEFVGWYKDKKCTDRWVMDEDADGRTIRADYVNSDITLYAKYKFLGGSTTKSSGGSSGGSGGGSSGGTGFNGWHKDNEGVWYYNTTPTQPCVDWYYEVEDGQWYHFDSKTGKMQVGYHVIDNKLYYFCEERKADNWVSYGDRYYCLGKKELSYGSLCMNGQYDNFYADKDGVICSVVNEYGGKAISSKQDEPGKITFYDSEGNSIYGLVESGNDIYKVNQNGTIYHGSYQMGNRILEFDRITGKLVTVR